MILVLKYCGVMRMDAVLFPLSELGSQGEMEGMESDISVAKERM